MSMFTLAISCLNTSNFPQALDQTFQDPVQYCSLQMTCTTRHIVNTVSFPPWPSRFICLDLLPIALCSSPVAYWTPSDLGGSSRGITSEKFPFLLCYMKSSWVEYPGGRVFPLRTLNLPGYSLLTFSVSGEESAGSLVGVLL